MANSYYHSGRTAFATKQIDWVNDTIKAVLIDTAYYTFDVTHDWLSDIAAGARVSTVALVGKSMSAEGACDANDALFTALTGPSVEAVAIYRDSGAEGTSQLIIYIDTASGLAFLPNGLDAYLVWDNGVNKIFRL